jgi:hypothetical protein
MTSKIELITPKIATEILENHNPRNRNVSDSTVSAYATDMKNGRWTLTHQGLAFDENNDLIDGQHRLWAVIFSGKEIEFMVTRGIPVTQIKNGVEINSMDNIDRGRVRGAGGQMQLSHGIKNGNTVAAACRGVALLINFHQGNKRLSFANSMFIYEQYGKDIEAIIDATDSIHRKQHIITPLAMYHHGEPTKSLEFTRQLISMEGLTAPVRVALKWLEAKHSVEKSEQTVRILCKCIHHFHIGTAKLDRVTDDDSGVKFIVGMFPSLNRRIADQLKPVPRMKIVSKLIKKN